MRGRVLLATWLIAGHLTVNAAQPTPDFSGQWTLEPDAVATNPGGGPAAQRGDMGSGWGPGFTIIQNGEQLTVEHLVFSRYDIQPPLRTVYALDGSETQNSVMIGHAAQPRRSRAAFRNQTLEITTLFPAMPAPAGVSVATEVVQRLTLESPALLILETTRRTDAGDAPVTTRSRYVRKN